MGKLLGIGSNSLYQLGQTHTEDLSSLTSIPLPSNFENPPINLIGGGNHTLIIDSKNQCFGCGDNGKNQLLIKIDNGKNNLDETLINELSFQKGINRSNNEENIIGLVKLFQVKILKIGLGFDHTLLKVNDTTIWCLGDNSNHQLGHLDKSIRFVKHTFSSYIKDLQCGPRSSVILLSDGSVWTFGKYMGNRTKLIGSDSFGLSEVKGVDGGVELIGMGMNHLTMVNDCNEIFTIGKNQFGQCGTQLEMKWVEVPFKIDLGELVLSNSQSQQSDSQFTKKIKKLVCGWHHNLILLTSTTETILLGFGRNHHYELTSSTKSISISSTILPQSDGIILDITSGSHHNLFLIQPKNNQGNEVWAWGWNEHFNCGSNDECVKEYRLLAKDVKLIGSGYGYSLIYQE